MARLLGVDYGVKRIGLAVSDPLGFMAQPLATVQRTSVREDLQKIADAVSGYEVSRIIVGLPLNMDGTEGTLTEQVRKFALQLEETLKVPAELYDERLTTWQAERMLIDEADMSRERRKAVRDKVAAAIILQAYMDKHK